MSTDVPTVDDYEADTIGFGDCDCDEPVPDPEHLELPDGTSVKILACAACGDAIDWAISGRTEDELRELVRSKQERIDELEARVDPEPVALEERETQLVTAHDPEAEQEIDRLEDELTRLQNRLDMVEHQNHSLESERQELADEVQALEAQLAETPTPLWKRVVSATLTSQHLGLFLGVVISLGTAALVWPVAQEAAIAITAQTEQVREPTQPIFSLSSAVLGVMLFFIGFIILAMKIGPRGIGR